MARQAARTPTQTNARPAPRTTSRRAAEAPVTPLKLPRHIKTLVVFGGSFDPPHHMHVLAPHITVRAIFDDAGWLLYVPTARNPLKPGTLAPDEHRLAMLRYAIDLPGQRSIWTDELDRAAWARERGLRPRPSYTIDTLTRLRKIVPARVQLRLLIGSDQVASFHKWKEPREILRLAEPLVVMRPPMERVVRLWTSMYGNRFWTREERLAWLSRLAPSVEGAMSSTDLRAAIPGAPRTTRAWSKREPLNTIQVGVARHIIRYNLYGHRPGAPRPLDPADMPPAPVGDDPTIARKVRMLDWFELSNAEWARVFRRINPNKVRTRSPRKTRTRSPGR